MKKMKKIMIYDDETAYREALLEKVASVSVVTTQFEIETMSNSDFNATIKTLKQRQKQLRNVGYWDDSEIPLDSASIFIIDYDLFQNEVDSFLTGENIAYVARCFSQCELIIALNRFDVPDFDLTLKGHPDSFADLNIRGEHLGNPNLWGEKGATEFHPWYWPPLPKFQEDFEKRVKDVKENIGSPICEVLGFDPELFDILPRSITQFVGETPTEANFRQFVQKSGNGLRNKDARNVGDEATIARVGAARISKWLERLVLPELDILVDAPHLISRYPSLITGDKDDIEIWNKTAKLMDYTKLGLDVEIIESHRFKKNFWLSRPTWFWDGVRECEEILEVREPWEVSRPNWIFCEDTSTFYEGDDYREFVAEVESPFARRFVRGFDWIDYQPRVGFAL